MKKIIGIICEFNPLHEGHIFLLGEARRLGAPVVCIMSGNFVQRGEAAIYDKYTRAKSALDSGADAVLELPFPWCAAPAEFFARAGVEIAHAAGVTDLIFGSECGDVDLIKKASELAECEKFKGKCASLYVGEKGFAAARYEAARELCPETAEVFNYSNDMLALEYIRQARLLGYSFDFHAVKRIDTKSASEIRRERAQCGEHAPSRELEKIEKTLFRLGKHSRDTFDFECGILNRLEKSAAMTGDFIAASATKKYTNARLRRAALFAVTGVGKESVTALPEYTVLLGANECGREIVKATSDIEVVTKPADAKCAQYKLEAYADRLYTCCMEGEHSGDEFIKKSPWIY